MTHPNAHIDTHHEPSWQFFAVIRNSEVIVLRGCAKCGKFEHAEALVPGVHV